MPAYTPFRLAMPDEIHMLGLPGHLHLPQGRAPHKTSRNRVVLVNAPPSSRNPRQRPFDERLRFLLNATQVLASPEAFRIQLVDLFRA